MAGGWHFFIFDIGMLLFVPVKVNPCYLRIHWPHPIIVTVGCLLLVFVCGFPLNDTRQWGSPGIKTQTIKLVLYLAWTFMPWLAPCHCGYQDMSVCWQAGSLGKRWDTVVAYANSPTLTATPARLLKTLLSLLLEPMGYEQSGSEHQTQSTHLPTERLHNYR